MNRSDLHPYQEKAIAFVEAHPKCALFLDLGLGKSVVALTAIQTLLDTFAAGRALIVAPLRVARHTWPEECRRWDHVDMTPNLILGNARQRERAAKTFARLNVINVDTLPWLIQHHGTHWPYDMVVLDESSLFKRPSTRRFKALKTVLPKIERLVLLTGTPAPNGLLDLWSQLYLLDGGQRLFRTYSGYRDHYFESDYNPTTWAIVLPRVQAPRPPFTRASPICACAWMRKTT